MRYISWKWSAQQTSTNFFLQRWEFQFICWWFFPEWSLDTRDFMRWVRQPIRSVSTPCATLYRYLLRRWIYETLYLSVSFHLKINPYALINRTLTQQHISKRLVFLNCILTVQISSSWASIDLVVWRKIDKPEVAEAFILEYICSWLWFIHLAGVLERMSTWAGFFPAWVVFWMIAPGYLMDLLAWYRGSLHPVLLGIPANLLFLTKFFEALAASALLKCTLVLGSLMSCIRLTCVSALSFAKASIACFCLAFCKAVWTTMLVLKRNITSTALFLTVFSLRMRTYLKDRTQAFVKVTCTAVSPAFKSAREGLKQWRKEDW